MNGRFWALSISLSVLICGCHGVGKKACERNSGVPTETGFVSKTIKVDGETFKYAVYVPENYDHAKKWPLMLFLHGAGERGTDGELQTTVGMPKFIRKHPEQFPCVVVMPQMRPETEWKGPMAKMALATLDSALQEYNIDKDRIVLTGLSMGGYGTWLLGAEETNRFCALLPVRGGGNPKNAPKLAKLPIWCFHGSADPVVPVQESRLMVQAVEAAGGEIKYTELPGVTHNSWDAAYGDPEVIKWMLAQHR